VAERRAAAEQAEIEARAAADNTFAGVAARFLSEHVETNLRPKTAREWRRIARANCCHAGARSFAEITRRDVIELLDDKAKVLPRQSDEIRKHLRTLFAWAADRELIDRDPTNVSGRARYVPRDCVLSDGELCSVWQACEPLGWPLGPLFRLLLLTGQQRDEVGAMSWSEIDLDARVWTIPAARAKNGKTHDVHLSDLAIEIRAALPRTGEMVFASHGPGAPKGCSHAKARLDGLLAATGKPPEASTPHDLRRSAASGMARLGIAPHVVDRC
jgi:integrase